MSAPPAAAQAADYTIIKATGHPIHLDPNKVEWIGTRFLDRTGRVFRYEGNYYRAIHPSMVEFVRALFKAGIYAEMMQRGWLVRTEPANVKMPGYSLVLKHESALHPSKPFHWSRSFIVESAKLFIECNQYLLKFGLGLQDANSANIQIFHNSRPKLVDFGSIQPLQLMQDGGGFSLLKFKEIWLNPIFLMTRGTQLDDIARNLMTHSGGLTDEQLTELTSARLLIAGATRAEQLQNALNWLNSIRFDDRKTYWAKYQVDARYETEFTPENLDNRSYLYYKIIESLHPRRVADLSCNNGRFSLMAAQLGTEVVALDYDGEAIELFHRTLRKVGRELPIAALIGNVMHDHGIAADLTLAPALIHHLNISQKFPWEAIAKSLARTTTEFLIVDFMPFGLGGTKPSPNLPAGYRLSGFVKALGRWFGDIEVVNIAQPASHSLRLPVICRERKTTVDDAPIRVRYSYMRRKLDPSGDVYRVVCPHCDGVIANWEPGMACHSCGRREALTAWEDESIA